METIIIMIMLIVTILTHFLLVGSVLCFLGPNYVGME